MFLSRQGLSLAANVVGRMGVGEVGRVGGVGACHYASCQHLDGASCQRLPVGASLSAPLCQRLFVGAAPSITTFSSRRRPARFFFIFGDVTGDPPFKFARPRARLRVLDDENLLLLLLLSSSPFSAIFSHTLLQEQHMSPSPRIQNTMTCKAFQSFHHHLTPSITSNWKANGL